MSSTDYLHSSLLRNVLLGDNLSCGSTSSRNILLQTYYFEEDATQHFVCYQCMFSGLYFNRYNFCHATRRRQVTLFFQLIVAVYFGLFLAILATSIYPGITNETKKAKF